MPSAPVIATPVVVASVPCRACDYNLRGLAHSAVCPECGVDVRGSLARAGPGFTDAQQARRVYDGLWWLSAFAPAMLVLAVTAAIFAFSGWASAFVARGWFDVASLTAALAASCAWSWGAWELAAPDRNAPRHEESQRRVLRTLALSAGLLRGVLLLSTLLGLLAGPLFSPSDLATFLWIWALPFALVLSFLQFSAEIGALNRLCLRLPANDDDNGARAAARELVWQVPLALSFGCLLAGLGLPIALLLYCLAVHRARREMRPLVPAR